MAQKQKPEDLRREALVALEKARAEMTAQAVELRHDLSPAEVARTAFQRHPVGMVAAAAGAGLVIGWLILRRKPAPPREIVRYLPESTRQRLATRALGSMMPMSWLGPVAAMAVKAAMPSLMKIAMKYYEQRTKPNHL